MNNTFSPLRSENIVYSKGSELKPLGACEGYYMHTAFTDNTPSAVVCSSSSEINATTDIFTQVAHGLLTGTILQATTSSALPTGLSLATDYFVIKIDADTFKLATSLANALARTAINITDVGTGDQTFTPVALAGASIKLQGTNEDQPSGTDWQDIADSSVTITATGAQAYNVSEVYYKSVRYYVTMTSGQLDVTGSFNGKGAF